jgi:protein-L-isoaspartate(D-aspartate) O-methyltransferase
MDETEQMISVIRAYGIDDGRIFEAMRRVPRHFFVPDDLRDAAYGDFPLQIGEGQTISQPYTVAFMLHHLDLKEGHHVLEIGSGSGWSAALMKRLVGKIGRVVTIERIQNLVMYAKENLQKVYSDIDVVQADGSEGLDGYAPYDRIIITAACPSMPPPLIKQLKDAGIIIAPVGHIVQQMSKGIKQGNSLHVENLGSFRFVPLIGKHGFGR